MFMTKSLLGVAVIMGLLVGGSVPVQAGSELGRFGWRLAPGCEVIVLQVTEEEGIFALHGFNELDGCGESRRVPAEGTAFVTRDGAIAMGVTILFPGTTIHVNARLDPNISGTWLDDVGNAGRLEFLGPRQ